MALWDRVKTMMAIAGMPDDMQTRAIDSFVDSPGLTEQLLRVQGLQPRPWRPASVTTALGVPAIFGAVNLIANLTGSLSMKALRGQVELPPDERPRVIVRPDPFNIPREFYRGTAYNLASRGEAWWWIAARDIDGNALSVLNVSPAEVSVTEDPTDLRYPIIEWRGRRMANADMRQLVYSREPGALRGHGPLQMCGAAISVAVEAQEWAATFYADGGYPSILIKAAGELGEADDGTSEADVLRDQFMAKDHNTPRVIDSGIEEVKQFPVDTAGASMMQSRGYQNGEVARMFNMPGDVLEYAMEGSSITYQNVGGAFENLLRRCLRPNYLEVIEQTMTDLLPRATVARFNTDTLTLADIKTRYDVYSVGIEKGIITVEQAQQYEGIAPGDVENAAVPFSPPQAVPDRLPIQIRSEAPPEAPPVRCDGTRLLRGVLRPCNKLLAEQGPFVGRCPRCGKNHEVAA